MKYYAYMIKDKTLKLRLTTLMTVRLEQKLGKNPLSIFVGDDGNETLPTIQELVTCMYYSLQAEHNKEYSKIDEVYNLFDEYVDDGGSVVDFIEVILEVFRVSGLVPEDTEDDNEKN